MKKITLSIITTVLLTCTGLASTNANEDIIENNIPSENEMIVEGDNVSLDENGIYLEGTKFINFEEENQEDEEMEDFLNYIEDKSISFEKRFKKISVASFLEDNNVEVDDTIIDLDEILKDIILD